MLGARGVTPILISAMASAGSAVSYAQTASDGQPDGRALRPAISYSPETDDPSSLDRASVDGWEAAAEGEPPALDPLVQPDSNLAAYPNAGTEAFTAETNDAAGPPAEALTGDYDSRPAAERALFALPPVDRDPLLYQVERIDPVTTDRRPQRLARIEPYDPVGLRLGSFVFFPETEVGGLMTSNAATSPLGGNDKAFEARSSARLVSDWSRHAVELRGSRTLSYFDNATSENDRAHLIEARGRLDITRRANVQGLFSNETVQESRSAIDARSRGERADITSNRAALAYNQRFNRLRTQLRGSITQTDYDDVRDGTVLIRNDDRDSGVHQGAFRASWEFKPALTAFAEVERNRRSFDAPGADGLRRNSSGMRYRAGIDFGSASEVLRGEISIGWGEQDADAASLGSASAWLLDANLVWRPSALTSLAFTAQSEIDNTTSGGSAFAVSRSAGVELRHAFKRHVIGSAGLTYLDRSYEGSGVSEEEWQTAIGLEYFLSRELIVFSRYQHTAFDSSSPGAGWHADDVRLGIRIRR